MCVLGILAARRRKLKALTYSEDILRYQGVAQGARNSETKNIKPGGLLARLFTLLSSSEYPFPHPLPQDQGTWHEDRGPGGGGAEQISLPKRQNGILKTGILYNVRHMDVRGRFDGFSSVTWERLRALASTGLRILPLPKTT